MEIEVMWDNEEKTIIRSIYPPVWSWEGVQEVVKREYELIEEVSHPVVVIGDMRKATMVPSYALTSAKHVFETRSKDIGITVLIGEAMIVQMVFKMIEKTHAALVERVHITMTDSEEKAYALIEAYHQQQNASS